MPSHTYNFNGALPLSVLHHFSKFFKFSSCCSYILVYTTLYYYAAMFVILYIHTILLYNTLMSKDKDKFLIHENNQYASYASLCSIHWHTWRSASHEPTFNPPLTLFFHLSIINTHFTLMGPLIHSSLQCHEQKSTVRFCDNRYKQTVFTYLLSRTCCHGLDCDS